MKSHLFVCLLFFDVFFFFFFAVFFFFASFCCCCFSDYLWATSISKENSDGVSSGKPENSLAAFTFMHTRCEEPVYGICEREIHRSVCKYKVI